MPEGPTPRTQDRLRDPALQTRLWALALICAIAVVYANSFAGVFVYDDIPGIVDNATIRSLASSAQPPRDSGLPVSGRPLVNLSLACNYAAGGINPWGYHLLNVSLHAGAALALLGVVRRVLGSSPETATLREVAVPVAGLTAFIWALHPLQTAAVTYISQRAEALVALCYLLTLYAWCRLIETPQRRWVFAATAACLAGMLSKEVMVSAPLVALLLDRTFYAGSFTAAWKARRGPYCLLAACWIILALLVSQSASRGGTAGFGTSVPWWAYALTQAPAILHYLRLCFWPAPLVFDYGTAIVTSPADVALPLGVLALLVAATLVALARRRAIGFLAFSFFCVLAPSSSVVPIASEVMAEHRMYLPLGFLCAAVVAAAARVFPMKGLLPVGALVAAALGLATAHRNTDYHSEMRLWQDTAEKAPGNPRAHFNLGELLSRARRWPEAIASYHRAVELRPGFASAHSNLSLAYGEMGRWAEAETHARQAIDANPELAVAHNNLGNALFRRGSSSAAGSAYQEAIRLDPRVPEFRNNLGAVHSQRGDLAAARREYEISLQLDDSRADTHYYLGNVAAREHRFTDAAQHYRDALSRQPDHAPARDNLARVLRLAGQSPP